MKIVLSILFIFVFLIIIFSFLDFKITNLLANLTQQLVIQEVNPLREKKLKVSEKLTEAAQLKAEDMIARNYFDHTGPDGELCWIWLDKVGYDYAAAGENLAIDVNDPKVLIDTWINSPSHAKNILNENFTDVGIGIAEGKIGDRKTIVVVMFLAREKASEEDVVMESFIIPRFLSLFLFRFFAWFSRIF